MYKFEDTANPKKARKQESHIPHINKDRKKAKNETFLVKPQEQELRRKDRRGDVPGVRVRRGREGAGKASGSRSLSVLRRVNSGHGCRESMAVLLSSSLLEDQTQVLLLSLCQAISSSVLISPLLHSFSLFFSVVLFGFCIY